MRMFLIVLLALLCAAPTWADYPPATPTITLVSMSGRTGDTFKIPVRMTNNDEEWAFWGARFSIEWNHSLFNVTGWDFDLPLEFKGGGGTYQGMDPICVGTDSIRFFVVDVNPSAPPWYYYGDVDIIHIWVVPKVSGTHTIQFSCDCDFGEFDPPGRLMVEQIRPDTYPSRYDWCYDEWEWGGAINHVDAEIYSTTTGGCRPPCQIEPPKVMPRVAAATTWGATKALYR